MKRPPIQNHITKPDAIDIHALHKIKLEESEFQNQQNEQQRGYANESQNGQRNHHSSNGNTAKTSQLTLGELEQDNHHHKDSSHSQATTDEIVKDEVKEERGKQQTVRKKYGRGLLLVIGVIALAVGANFGVRWWQFQNTHVSTENAQIKGHLSPLSAKIPATVQQILVKDGDYVKAGQSLLILEDQDLNLKVQQAEAAMAEAQAQLKEAKDTVSITSQTNPTQVQQAQSNLAAKASAVSAAQANINQALAKVETNQAGVTQAQTAVNRTQADFHRYEQLYREGAISAQQLDTARAAYENAQAELTAAKKTVTQSQAEVKNAQAQQQSARAEVATAQGQVAEKSVFGQTVTVQKDQQEQALAQLKQAQATLELARQQLNYTVMKAPISGYVGQLTAQVGQKVLTGQPLLSVVSLQTNAVYVDANFKETALGKLQIGEKAEVEVDAYPGETFHATIAGISPATGASFALIPPDNATGNYNKVVQWVPIRLVFDPSTDPQHKLRPGLSVKVTVNITTSDQVASTPR
ncbi:HlyD family secretion protein [Anabaena sp. PCC 7108]|uniref:HlyD family secretion protein n=1 Tax=Anabaena sp. PCC 7108 TaxID=163908 RepID=UPI00034AFF5D|nr:HlyD family secretion protein [Anabaena sp. PCC 7108]